MSGLYSRVLNERLTDVVENHKLLGEIQNGFHRCRSGSDNAFILDSILWKSKAKKAKVYILPWKIPWSEIQNQIIFLHGLTFGVAIAISGTK